jgi:hypothetical protein
VQNLIDINSSRKLQERFEKDDLQDKLIASVLDRTVFDIVNNLQETQVRTEKSLFNERQKLIKQAKGNILINW